MAAAGAGGAGGGGRRAGGFRLATGGPRRRVSVRGGVPGRCQPCRPGAGGRGRRRGLGGGCPFPARSAAPLSLLGLWPGAAEPVPRGWLGGAATKRDSPPLSRGGIQRYRGLLGGRGEAGPGASVRPSPRRAARVPAGRVTGGLCQGSLGANGSSRCRSPPSDPLLQPYFPSRHGPRHSHRYVRDCQPLKYGNVTHETWPSDNRTGGPVATTRTFVSYVPPEGKDRKVVYGHFTFVRNPLRTFSVLEPGGVGGCEAQRRAPVEETAKFGKCLVAQNGGYFDMGTGECLGNVVSDGKLVKNSGGLQNAQFGIRKDGTMVFG